MQIDVIVPNFDEHADEVTLTAWYKKEGEIISKNEIIADAETSAIACGITSSYDCVLMKILVQEGATISPGTKIAVIETELNAAANNVTDKALIEEESQFIDSRIEEDLQAQVAAQNNEQTENEPAPPTQDDDSDLVAASEKLGHTVEREVLKEELEMGVAVDTEALQDFAGEAESKFINILKNAEAKAKEEAMNLRKKILEEAERLANVDGKALQEKILKEYEEKAIQEANEMHTKIVQGSLAEAQATKINIIEDAKASAEIESVKLREEVLAEAYEAAVAQAEEKTKIIISEAEQRAYNEGAERAKSIIEATIDEAKSQAKEIKKDIIHSATKHAEKESKDIVREMMKTAKDESKWCAHELIEATKKEALCEAEKLRHDIVAQVRQEVESVVCGVKAELLSKANDELCVANSSIHSAIQAMLNTAIDGANGEIQSANNELKCALSNVLNAALDSVNEEITQANDEIKSAMQKALSSALNQLSTEATSANNGMHDAMKDALDNAIGIVTAEQKQANTAIQTAMRDALNIALDSINNEAKAANNEIKSTVQYVMQSVQDEVKTAVDQVIELEEQKKNTIEKLLNINSCDLLGVCAEYWNKPKFFDTPGDCKESVDMMRKHIHERANNTYDSSAISTVSTEVDMSAVLTLESSFGKEFEERYNTRLGFTPFFVLACIEALKRYKMFNAHILNDEVFYKNTYDISIVTRGRDGVAAPVIRSADQMTISEIERSMIELSKRAVEGTLSVEEVSGGTFTLINAGRYGSLIGSDMLTPPQVATLSVHKMSHRPVATSNGVEVKPMLYISLSYDHIVADTQQASAFIECVKNYVENPGFQLLGL